MRYQAVLFHSSTQRTLRSAFSASILTLSRVKFSFVYFRVCRYNKGPQCIPEYYYTKLLTEYTTDCCRTNVVNFHFGLKIM